MAGMGSMSPTWPSASRPSRRMMSRVVLRRSAAAAMAPSCDQVPSPWSRDGGATTKKVEVFSSSMRRSSARSSSASTVSLATTRTRDMATSPRTRCHSCYKRPLGG